MGLHHRRKLLLATMSLAILVALPGIAQAHQESGKEEGSADTPPPPPVTEVTSVLPVLGSGLTVSLTRDDAGNLTQVALDPSGATIVKEGDHKVVFLLADGDTQVVVKSYSKEMDDEERAGGVKTTVTADATADVTGPGSWSADVFGTGVVTIPYTVSWDGNNPTITIGEIVLPAGVTAEIGEPKVKMSDEKSKFKISVALSNGEDDAKVSFHASARFDDDDDDDGDESELKVKLAITLDANSHVDCRDDDDRDDDRDRDDDEDEVAGASVSSNRWDDDDDDRDHDDDDDHDRGGDDDDDGDHDHDRDEDDDH